MSLEYKIETVNPKTLDISKFNVRKRDVQGTTWEEFLEDIKKNGVHSPPIVSPSDQVITGQRRVLAAKKVGLEEINILRLKNEPSKVEAIAMSIRENHHREALYQDDRLDAIIILRDELNNDKQAVADAIGVKKYTVQAWLSMEAIRKQVPEISKVGLDKGRAIKSLLETEAYKDKPIQEKRQLVHAVKDQTEGEIRQMRRDVENETPVHREAIARDVRESKAPPAESYLHVTLAFPATMHAFLLKKANQHKKTFPDYCMEVMREHARDIGYS